MSLMDTFISVDFRGEIFVLSSRYLADSFLGAGAFGAVCSARDESTKASIAIKKCKQILGSKMVLARTIREVRLLRKLCHPNIITILGVMPIPDISKFSEIYIIFERMEDDLGSLIASASEISMGLIELFLWQLLRALEYMHSANIVHRDLK